MDSIHALEQIIQVMYVLLTSSGCYDALKTGALCPFISTTAKVCSGVTL